MFIQAEFIRHECFNGFTVRQEETDNAYHNVSVQHDNRIDDFIPFGQGERIDFDIEFTAQPEKKAGPDDVPEVEDEVPRGIAPVKDIQGLHGVHSAEFPDSLEMAFCEGAFTNGKGIQIGVQDYAPQDVESDTCKGCGG